MAHQAAAHRVFLSHGLPAGDSLRHNQAKGEEVLLQLSGLGTDRRICRNRGPVMSGALRAQEEPKSQSWRFAV